MSLTLKFYPEEPSAEEASVLMAIGTSGMPIIENTEGHVCVGSGDRRAIAANTTSNDEWRMFAEGDSTMYYKAYCDLATGLKTAAITVASGIMFSQY